ncbi:uncharacterized protein CC84DRAFT_1242809 [Paraphaeosphaeria sporulosa]|uniref:Uncharacterized protein n=1 Tax=Paraphaeosphaeria sporulosa TaxID=1460663 RepID=A0A177CIK4_9PLEO|nr:uncharacterized protein CC84DRAFT_1242809 [Paraphaeosphaeria sporulosa]OAG07345.1 hypothetical protein CC84DRAFT_1242809 [Paraphaeosphaeria sporulosa]
MNASTPRSRGRPKKYHTEEERREASRISAKKSAQKKREEQRAAADASQTRTASSLQRSSVNITSNHFRSEWEGNPKFPSDLEGFAYVQNKIATDPARFDVQAPLSSEYSGRTPTQFEVSMNFVGTSLPYSPHGLPHANTGPSHDLNPDAFGYPPWNPVKVNSMAIPSEYSEIARQNSQMGHSRSPQLLNLLRNKGRSSAGHETTAKARNAQEGPATKLAQTSRLIEGGHATLNGGPPRPDTETKAAKHLARVVNADPPRPGAVLKQALYLDHLLADAVEAKELAEKEAAARRMDETTRQERLRRAAQQEKSTLKRAHDQAQALAEQPQDDFDRHIRFVFEWLQADSYGRQHTFPTDGQAIYTTKIRPRIHQIQRSSLSQSATFAIQGSRVGDEILRYYDADARLNNVDELTSAMLAIFENVVTTEKEWLKMQQGAAAVLMQEMYEVWPMVCAAGPAQVQRNLGGVLWTCFRYKAVPRFHYLASSASLNS